MHSILNNRQVETKFIAYQELESKQLVYDYLTDPGKFPLGKSALFEFCHHTPGVWEKGGHRRS